MSIKWDYAIDFVLKHEGGLSEHKSDPGGTTKYGVSLVFLKSQGYDVNDDGQINEDDIKALTPPKAKHIYKQFWWDKYKYERIHSTRLAAKVFDLAVNMGAAQAHKLLQRAINRCKLPFVEVDGVIGKGTLAALHAIDEYKLYDMINEVAREFYIHLVEVKPALTVFLRGWLNRVKE